MERRGIKYVSGMAAVIGWESKGTGTWRIIPENKWYD